MTKMLPNNAYTGKGKEFWSYVRLVSQQAGYQPRGSKIVKKYTEDDLRKTIRDTGINGEPLFGGFPSLRMTELGGDVLDYLNYRSCKVKEAMDKIRTRKTAEQQFNNHKGDHKLIYFQRNKQGNNEPLVFANTVNMVIEREYGTQFDPNPRELPTILDSNGNLLMTLARWLDGAVPNIRNPIAVWEVKEFYSSSSFGSRVADTIYETMLISQEARTLKEQNGRDLEIYLLTDGYEAWRKGVSYICRIIDILHMGYINAAIFGEEVFQDWSRIVRAWRDKITLLPGEQ